MNAGNNNANQEVSNKLSDNINDWSYDEERTGHPNKSSNAHSAGNHEYNRFNGPSSQSKGGSKFTHSGQGHGHSGHSGNKPIPHYKERHWNRDSRSSRRRSNDSFEGNSQRYRENRDVRESNRQGMCYVFLIFMLCYSKRDCILVYCSLFMLPGYTNLLLFLFLLCCNLSEYFLLLFYMYIIYCFYYYAYQYGGLLF